MPPAFSQIFNNENIDGDYHTTRRSPKKPQEKPCRACTDFKSWVKFQKNKTVDKFNAEEKRSDCPLDKDELGRNTWSFLHTMAAYYPDDPNPEVQNNMSQFFSFFSQFYPCSVCAEDFAKMISQRPPETSSQVKLSQWLCWAHNNVNRKLGKPEFDCSLVDQRWLTGWSDGTCG